MRCPVVSQQLYRRKLRLSETKQVSNLNQLDQMSLMNFDCRRIKEVTRVAYRETLPIIGGCYRYIATPLAVVHAVTCRERGPGKTSAVVRYIHIEVCSLLDSARGHEASCRSSLGHRLLNRRTS